MNMRIKKILKYIEFFTLVILAIFMTLIILIVISALSSKNRKSTGEDSGSIIMEYNGNEKMPEFKHPDPIYADTLEEALSIVDAKKYFGDDLYANKVSYIIKIFENEEYATMFYLSDKNSKEGTFLAAKFKINTVNKKKQYALIDAVRQGYSNGGLKVEHKNDFNTFNLEIQVFDYMNLSSFSVTEGNRFIFGWLDTKNVKTLKIEGQSPTEIIEFPLYGEKNYFWYYENLISNKPTAEFDIETEECLE